MKSNNKTNKAIEFLYELSLRDDFQADIQAARDDLGIPKSGFQNAQERELWANKLNGLDFFSVISHLLEKYSISVAYYVPLQEYIELNKLQTNTHQIDLVAMIDEYAHKEDLESPIEDLYREWRQPFVKMILFGNGSKSDVHDFIDKNWKHIEDIFLEQGKQIGQRVRVKREKERDRLIIELSKQSKKELGNEHAKYKDLLIQGKMSEMGYKVSDGYIRKIISKYTGKAKL